jgi:hypothetical protein
MEDLTPKKSRSAGFISGARVAENAGAGKTGPTTDRPNHGDIEWHNA